MLANIYQELAAAGLEGGGGVGGKQRLFLMAAKEPIEISAIEVLFLW